MSTWWKKTSDLDAEQLKVIALPKDGNHLVLGPAGCGKTNLLLLRASFLFKAGVKDVKVLTFGRVLKEFIAAGSTNYPFSADKVQTYVAWGAGLLSSNGIPFIEKGDFSEVRARLLDGLRQLASLKRKENISDCILLDEAQDYSAEEIGVLCSFAKQVYAVGDERQRITESIGGLDELEKICGTPTVLVDHYRNGLRICRVADGIRNLIDSEDGMEASSKYNEFEFESSAIALPAMVLADQVSSAVEEISTQLVAYPGDTIGILCPRQEETNAVAGLLSTSIIRNDVQVQNFIGGYSAFDPDKRVIVTTVHGAKGLEFRALHLLGMDMVKRFRMQKNLSFTGVTRAKTSLRIYYEGSLPGYLDKGLAAVDNAPVGDPALDDLFL